MTTATRRTLIMQSKHLKFRRFAVNSCVEQHVANLCDVQTQVDDSINITNLLDEFVKQQNEKNKRKRERERKNSLSFCALFRFNTHKPLYECRHKTATIIYKQIILNTEGLGERGTSKLYFLTITKFKKTYKNNKSGRERESNKIVYREERG